MRRIPILAILTAVFTAGFALAQQAPDQVEAPPESTPAPAPAPQAGPAALTLAEVSGGLETTAEILRDVGARIAPTTDVFAISGELTATIVAIDTLQRTSDLESLEQQNLRRLERLRTGWGRFGKRVDTWQETLRQRQKELALQRDRLQEQEQLWRTTSESLAGEELPQELVDRFDAILRSTKELHTKGRERQDGLLSLQDRLFDQERRIRDVLGRIDAAEEKARRELFQRDSAPLWRAFAATERQVILDDEAAEVWEEHTTDLREFLADHRQRMLLHLGLFVLLLLTLFRLRATTARQEGGTERTAVDQVLERPISTAALISLVLSRWIYGDLPVIALETLLLVVLIPLLRLLPRMIHPDMVRPLYGLVALSVVDRCRDFAASSVLLSRLFLFGVTVLALGGLLWLFRPGGGVAARKGGPWWRATRLAGRAAAALFAASLLLNLWGNVMLAHVITEAVVWAAYSAVLLYAGTLVLQAVVQLMMRSRAAGALRVIAKHREELERRIFSLIRIGTMVWWFWILLRLFGLETVVLDWVAGVLNAEWSVGTLQLSLGGILAFALALWLTVLISRAACTVLETDVLSRLSMARGKRGAVIILVRYALITVGFLIALAAAGIQLSQFALIAGALGVGIGFGLQGVVNNFVSGLILAFERPIQIGDVIEVGALRGEVRHIGIRASTVRTFEGAEVIIPNGNLTSDQVINWTLSDRARRIEVLVGVAYGTDPGKVLEILASVAKSQDDVLKWPEPRALFRGFGDSSLDFCVRFWTSNYEEWLPAQSKVAVALHDALKEAGITIPFPQRDLHVRSVDESVNLSGRGEPDAE